MLEPLFNIAASPTPTTLLRKRPWHRCFSVNFLKFLRTHFLQNTSGRLFLDISDFFLGSRMFIVDKSRRNPVVSSVY